MGLFQSREEKDKERANVNREIFWPRQDKVIEELSNEETPLNDHFAEGKSIYPESTVRYIAALERRIARLENE